jgi:hypothetical protein
MPRIQPTYYKLMFELTVGSQFSRADYGYFLCFDDQASRTILALHSIFLRASVSLSSASQVRGGCCFGFGSARGTEHVLDTHGLAQRTSHEELHAFGSSWASNEASNEMVRRGCCRSLDPRLAGTSLLGRSTPTASGVRKAIQGESSFAGSTQQSNPRAAHPIDERTAIQMTMW